jgi:hypothetical protein
MFAILGFTQISKGDEGDSLSVGLGLFEDGLEVGVAYAIILHFAWVDVKVAEDGHDVFIIASLKGGAGSGTVGGTGGKGCRGGKDDGEDGELHG